MTKLTMTYGIQGMHCRSCIDKIKTALESITSILTITLEPPRVILSLEKPLKLEVLNAELEKVGSYKLYPLPDVMAPVKTEDKGLKAYYPIFLIAGFITGITLINNISIQGLNSMGWMNQFMAGFFLVFSFFKLLNIKGFAEGYATYDLLAKRWFFYGSIYPFLELGLGLLYLLQWFPLFTQIFTVILMSFSSLGVLQALAKKQTIRCACLGTILNVPLSSITLVEDILMVLLAAIAIFVG